MGSSALIITGAIAAFVLLNVLILSFPSVVFDWHRQISDWPECICYMNNESVVDKDLSPSWRTTAEARVTGICDESPNESLDVLLKYPPAPEWLNYASEDATNTEVATWVGQFRAHVDPSSDSEGVHLAYTSPPDITDAVIVAVIAILADIVAVVAGVVLLVI